MRKGNSACVYQSKVIGMIRKITRDVPRHFDFPKVRVKKD